MSKEDKHGVVEYKSMTGETLQLSKSIIKQYLVSGDADKVSDQEVMMFLSLCKFQRLNPFLREAYLIKYGNSAATIVVGKETFLKRAAKNQKYRGHKTGIEDDGAIAWAEVYVEGYEVPIRCEVDFDEYVGKKRDGTVNAMWTNKPNTMLKKVALVQALREAFPEDFGGMYSQEEINTIQSDLPMDDIVVEEQPSPQRKSSSAAKKTTGTTGDKKTATPAQVKMIHAKLKKAEITDVAFKGYMGIASMNNLLFEEVNDALKAIEEGKIPKDVTPSESSSSTDLFEGEDKEW